MRAFLNHLAVRNCLSLTAALSLAWFNLAHREAAAGVVVTATEDAQVLAQAVAGNGVTVTGANILSGARTGTPQFGTFSNFSLIGNGIVLSTGDVRDVQNAPQPGDFPSTDALTGGTSEFQDYATAHIPGYNPSLGVHDVAALQIDFQLATASAVAFDFVFGSAEYPEWSADYSDAFLAFVDGTSPRDQIAFESAGVPVTFGSVGSFQHGILSANTETAFGLSHGLLPRLTATTGVLAAGNHSLWFEIGDVNDPILDSAVFLSNLRRYEGGSIESVSTPEPGTLALTGIALTGLWATQRVRRREKSSLRQR